MVVLNKTFGLSHIKVAAVFHAFFGITLTRGASVQIALRAAERLGPAVVELYPWTVDPPGHPRRLQRRLTWLLLRPGRLDR